jgi:hypothetical protein
MATDPQGRVNKSNSTGGAGISEARLWFGTLTTFIIYTSLGFLDVVVVWIVTNQETYGIPRAHIIARIIFGVVGFALLIVSIYSGMISYRNWQKLSPQPLFLNDESVERREYLARLGVLMTVTLGMGILWLALPTIFLDFCWRAR